MRYKIHRTYIRYISFSFFMCPSLVLNQGILLCRIQMMSSVTPSVMWVTQYNFKLSPIYILHTFDLTYICIYMQYIRYIYDIKIRYILYIYLRYKIYRTYIGCILFFQVTQSGIEPGHPRTLYTDDFVRKIFGHVSHSIYDVNEVLFI